MHSGRGDQSCSLGLGFGWPSTGIGLPNPGESALLEAGPRWDWMGGQEAAGSTKEPGRVVSQPHAPSYHQPCPPYRTPSPLTCCRPGSQTIRHKTATEEELTPASCLPVFFPGVPSSPAHPGRRQGLLIFPILQVRAARWGQDRLTSRGQEEPEGTLRTPRPQHVNLPRGDLREKREVKGRPGDGWVWRQQTCS